MEPRERPFCAPVDDREVGVDERHDGCGGFTTIVALYIASAGIAKNVFYKRVAM